MLTTKIVADDTLENGYRLGEYTLLESIGYGGEAMVWSGWNNRRQRVVAIKVMASPRRQSGATQLVSNDFERQVHLLASLEHPHILPLYEFGTTDEFYYFAMRYNALGSLADQLLAGPLPLPDALNITAQICSALSYLHGRSIVHRDLKPSNVLLGSQMRAYLTDFGLARQLKEETMLLHTGRGTGPYAPYEQVTRMGMSPRSDIFSLGILIYEMLAGKLPWDGANYLGLMQAQERESVLPDIREINPDVPPSVTKVLRMFTSYSSWERPASAEWAFELLETAVPTHKHFSAPDLTTFAQRSEDEQTVLDAQTLLNRFLPEWDPDSEGFPVRLTHLVLIDEAFSYNGPYQLPVDKEIRCFMLRGALVYDYHVDRWWQELADLPLRWQICGQAIANEEDEVVNRVLYRLLDEPEEELAVSLFSATALDRLIGLAVGAHSWTVRHNAFQLLERLLPLTGQWQSVGLTEQGDVKLAAFALTDNPQAKQAAQLIGKMRSETAVQTILHTETGERQQTALRIIQNEAGSLPGIVPFKTRFHLKLLQLKEQIFADRAGLSLSRMMIGLLAGVLVTILLIFGLFSQLNVQAQDALLRPYPVSGIVTIVAVDDASLERYGRWDQWSRSLHAELIERLSEAGARAIVLDFVFDSQTPDDAPLLAAIRQAGNVVQPVAGQGDAYHDLETALRYKDLIAPRADFIAASAALGHTNILHDSDGYVRRLPTVITVNGEQYPSLALAALQTFLTGSGDLEIPAVENGRLEIIGRQIPVDTQGVMAVYYAGPPARPEAQTFQIISYQDVLDGNVDNALFRDKIVLVGITATAEPDRYLTPVSEGRLMYGVEILANVIESIWSNHFISYPNNLITSLILLALGVIVGLLCARPWSGLLLAIVVAVIYILLVFWVFDSSGIMLDIFYPLLTIALSYVMVTTYRYSVEVRRRREFMQLFAANVTPKIAQATITAVKKGEINLSGQSREISVLFADIRGTSHFAEQQAPEAVIEMVNQFRQLAVEVIFAFKGTMAQHEGDQTMAVFNAPLSQPDHADRVIEMAVALRNRIETYHQALPADHPHRLIQFGYGIYTGRAIVGYAESANRPVYTALGEPISIASHLAEEAKPGQILIAEITYTKASGGVNANPMTPISIKGRVTPLSILSVDQTT